jgi:hypothetical protein
MPSSLDIFYSNIDTKVQSFLVAADGAIQSHLLSASPEERLLHNSLKPQQQSVIKKAATTTHAVGGLVHKAGTVIKHAAIGLSHHYGQQSLSTTAKEVKNGAVKMAKTAGKAIIKEPKVIAHDIKEIPEEVGHTVKAIHHLASHADDFVKHPLKTAGTFAKSHHALALVHGAMLGLYGHEFVNGGIEAAHHFAESGGFHMHPHQAVALAATLGAGFAKDAAVGFIHDHYKKKIPSLAHYALTRATAHKHPGEGEEPHHPANNPEGEENKSKEHEGEGEEHEPEPDYDFDQKDRDKISNRKEPHLAKLTKATLDENTVKQTLKTKIHGLTSAGFELLAQWMYKIGDAMERSDQKIPVGDWIRAFTAVNEYEKKHGSLGDKKANKLVNRIVKKKAKKDWDNKEENGNKRYNKTISNMVTLEGTPIGMEKTKGR